VNIASIILDAMPSSAEPWIDYGFRGGVIAVLAWLGKKYLTTQERLVSEVQDLTAEVKKALRDGIEPYREEDSP
jgi:hypothetical protein